ncbi:methyltransferase domain-containing protein [Pelagibacterales bacterium SAG-MED37]|nr:methyltransferase domain-containing protein [Pelagibacterales bacterium SAG-MED37]
MKNEEYKKFVINYKPFEWEVNDSDFRERVRGKHSFLMSFERFYKVFLYLEELKNKGLNNPKILDVGSFPGNMIHLTKKIYNNFSDYYSIGLDLDEKFVNIMNKYNVKCIDTEIDPQFPSPKKILEWDIKNFDISFLLDTIEHLVDPTHCLDQINKSLKIEGYLLITTDNITNFLYIAEMLRKGKSPNVHPVLSSMVYTGNHRPHHKEFSKDELKFLLERSGFELIKHEYFDRKQGDYFIDKKTNLIKKHKLKKTLKNIIFELIKNIGFSIPHLRNHQIVLAKKVKNIEEVKKNRMVTTSIKEWQEIRKKTIGY